MKAIHKDRATQIQDAIREVLYRDLDPIGVCGMAPDVEYDSYIGRIYRLLSSAPTREAVAQELQNIEIEIMCYERAEGKLNLAVADKLLAVDIHPKS